MASENGDVWPRWPSVYENPLPLVDVQCKLNVDALFELLYAPGSEYVVSVETHICTKALHMSGSGFLIRASRTQCIHAAELQWFLLA